MITHLFWILNLGIGGSGKIQLDILDTSGLFANWFELWESKNKEDDFKEEGNKKMMLWAIYLQ